MVPNNITKVTIPCAKFFGFFVPTKVKIWARQGLILTGKQVITLKVIATLAIFMRMSLLPLIIGRSIISGGVRFKNEKYPINVDAP